MCCCYVHPNTAAAVTPFVHLQARTPLSPDKLICFLYQLAKSARNGAVIKINQEHNDYLIMGDYR